MPPKVLAGVEGIAYDFTTPIRGASIPLSGGIGIYKNYFIAFHLIPFESG
jgi:hypothetical protein